MNEIACHKGRCFEVNGREEVFNSIFNKKNIVDQIQLDIMKNLTRL